MLRSFFGKGMEARELEVADAARQKSVVACDQFGREQCKGSDAYEPDQNQIAEPGGGGNGGGPTRLAMSIALGRRPPSPFAFGGSF